MNEQQKHERWPQAITQQYLRSSLPYEFIVETLALQNKQIYQLEKNYVALKQAVQSLPPPSKDTAKFLSRRSKALNLQRKKFAVQALVENQQEYRKKHENKTSQLQEQKHELSSRIISNKTNILLCGANGAAEMFDGMMEFYKNDQDTRAVVSGWKKDHSMYVKKQMQ